MLKKILIFKIILIVVFCNFLHAGQVSIALRPGEKIHALPFIVEASRGQMLFPERIDGVMIDAVSVDGNDLIPQEKQIFMDRMSLDPIACDYDNFTYISIVNDFILTRRNICSGDSVYLKYMIPVEFNMIIIKYRILYYGGSFSSSMTLVVTRSKISEPHKPTIAQ